MHNTIVDNKTPYYQQVSRVLRKRVKTGIYKNHTKLPSVRALSSDFGVSINVIQRAIRHLEKDGIVASQHGKGVRIIDDELAKQSAILFGFIHPYPPDMIYERRVLHFAQEAFETRNNLVVVRSSKDKSSRERELVQHMYLNGFQGLLIWPVANSSNGKFFKKLSTKIPIVLVDRLLPETDLSGVIIDSYGLGEMISNYILNQSGKKRLLVVMDNLNISPYQEMVRGLCDQAEKSGRQSDITIIYEAITTCIKNADNCDYSETDEIKERLIRLLAEGKHDALFCQHDDFLDLVVFQSGVNKYFKDIQFLTTESGQTGTFRSRAFNQAQIVKFRTDFSNMINKAADMVQDLILDKSKGPQVLKTSFELVTRVNKRVRY